MENNEKAKCSIGQKLEEQCNETIFCRSKGFINVHSLRDKEKMLIQWRSGIFLEDDDFVCFHHQQIFLIRYERLQRYCIDPKKCHKSKITSKYDSYYK